ncbi:MAG TPA: hypothetical protein VGG18_10300 [Granulicella sp.]
MKLNAMRHLLQVVFLMTGSCIAFAVQSPAGPPPATVPPARTPSAIMQPALDRLQQTLGALRTEKWKTSGAVREGTEANINSIHRDLEDTLPPLLTAADGAPNSVTQLLPAFRNIEALYDVLLRITEAGRGAASSQQVAALEDARARLEDARRVLGDRLQTMAVAQEQRVHTLQAAVRAIPPPPAPVVCPPPPPVKKHRPRRKPVVKKPAPAPAPTSTPAPTKTQH